MPKLLNINGLFQKPLQVKRFLFLPQAVQAARRKPLRTLARVRLGHGSGAQACALSCSKSSLPAARSSKTDRIACT